MKHTREHKTTDASETVSQHTGVVRPLDANGTNATQIFMKKQIIVMLTVYIVLILLGVGTGYVLASKGAALPVGSVVNTEGTGESDRVVGIQDASKYSNCPVGTLEADGIEGEGTHHLVREGGPSQTAYLMSSLIDLDQYVGLTVKVCGTTMQARTAPWLMDVERLELQ